MRPTTMWGYLRVVTRGRGEWPPPPRRAQAHFYTPALRSRASAPRAGARTDPMTCTTSWIRGARVLLLELRASRVRAGRLSPPAGRIATSDLLKNHAVLLAASGNDAQLRMPILAARAEEMGEPISVR